MSLLRRCRVNAALTIQLFSQLFHFINMWLFNRLVTDPESGLCSHYWGAIIRQQLGHVEAWAEKQGLELAADCHLSRIVQVGCADSPLPTVHGLCHQCLSPCRGSECGFIRRTSVTPSGVSHVYGEGNDGMLVSLVAVTDHQLKVKRQTLSHGSGSQKAKAKVEGGFSASIFTGQSPCAHVSPHTSTVYTVQVLLDLLSLLPSGPFLQRSHSGVHGVRASVYEF